MSWEHVLLWVVCLSTGLSLVYMIRAKTPIGRPWFLIIGAIFVFTLSGFFWAKRFVAVLSGLMWLLIAVIPSLILRWTASLAEQHKYKQVLFIHNTIGRLYPLANLKMQKEIVSIFLLMDESREEEAIARFEVMVEEKGPMQFFARYMIFRLKDDWEGLLSFIEARAQEEGSLDPLSLQWKVRALAELGRLQEMIEIYTSEEGQVLASLDHGFDTSLLLFAFTGKVAETERLFAGPLRRWLPPVKEVYLATAMSTSGQREEASAIFEQLLEADSPSVRKRAQVRLEQPPPLPEEVLDEEQREAIDQMAASILKELQYVGSQDSKRSPLWTWVFAVSLLVVFLICEWLGGSTDTRVLFDMGAMMPVLVVEKGHYWRLFTFPFLHFGPLHLILNLVALFYFGPYVERTLGASKYLLLLLLSAVGGGCLIVLAAQSGLFQAGGKSLMFSAYVGASGAIFGLIGAMLGVMLKGWLKDSASLAKRQLSMLVLIIALQTLFDLNTPNVSVGAHWSGLIIGLVWGWLVWSPKVLEAQRQSQVTKDTSATPS